MSSQPDKPLHPPLPVWKLALLLLATATLYQFVWLYRLAENLRDKRDASIQPLHWALIPLLGPLAFIPGQKLAAYLKQWQIDEDKEIGHLADPVMVGMMMFVAYLPTMMLIADPETLIQAVVLSLLLLSLAYLPLQGQLNRNMQTTESSEFRSEPGQLDPQHLWGGAAGLLLSVPLYVTLFTDLRENWDASDLAVGELLQSESGLFQVRVADEGWSQVGPEFMDEEAEMSFYGPSEWTWAVVYDYGGWHVDDVMEFRVQSIKENYSRASCTQTKTLDEATWTVTGSILCEGRSVLDGPYTYVSRVLRSEENVIEIVASTSDYDPDQSRRLSTRIQSFVDGLELIQ